VEHVSTDSDRQGVESELTRGLGIGKEARVELERGGKMFGEVGRIVAAGIEMEFVGDVTRGEDFVEGGGAGVEAVVVVVAAVEINF
jgi:hypothetical protein